MEPPVSDRLNGWKEIAAYLGKGVRTVQRWEGEYGLPIRRLGREGGEIVFAYRSELEAWSRQDGARRQMAAAEESATSPIAPSGDLDASTAVALRVESSPAAAAPDRGRVITGPAALLALALGVLSAAAWATLRPGAQPLTWQAVGTEIQVFGAGARLLWRVPLPVGHQASAYVQQEGPRGTHPVLVEDIDGDGRNEVLLVSRPVQRGDTQGLIVFNADGTERFRYLFDGQATFGDETYASPWLAHGLWVLPNSDGTRSIWVTFIHSLWFPTLLTELTPDGDVRSTYWSNGYVNSVTNGHWRGAPIVVVGATNNDFKSASVAVFDRRHVGGAAPADRTAYRCTTCGDRVPDLFLVFPRRCVAHALDGQHTVFETWIDADGVLHAGVVDGPRAHLNEGIVTWYAIAPDLTLRAVEFGSNASVLHVDLERNGVLDHAFGERDAAAALPVKRWDGSAFVDLPRLPMTLQ